ncbi:hypothetical protein HFN01_07275 [Rhizobium leguminosarum]|uniref:hypothetical protein n=1 Tax=Rhizobium leguminosarum TaxID=384 RepID=UPI001C947101|nr:hypothetical protein [Rhizobium leguminosarum]MBY5394628.1 hypothetical protein [Rhizobium leguminosarum]
MVKNVERIMVEEGLSLIRLPNDFVSNEDEGYLLVYVQGARKEAPQIEYWRALRPTQLHLMK